MSKYITIQDFMVRDLGLQGNELLVYALVYGFSQDGESEFKGSVNYVADWLNIAHRTAIDVLKRLCEKGLLVKRQEGINGKLTNYYSARTTRAESAPLPVQNLHPTREESALVLNNNNNNYNNNTEKEKIKKEKEPFADVDLGQYEYMRPQIVKWLEYKKARQEMYKTSQSILIMAKKLHEMSGGNAIVANDIIEQSIMNNWAGLFALKNNRAKQSGSAFEEQVRKFMGV